MSDSPPARATRAAWICGGLYLCLAGAAAWSPADRLTWVLENLIALPLAVGVMLRAGRLPLGVASHVLLFTFLGLHAVGSHYTYSAVPYAEWSEHWLGWNPGPGRNHFDRGVHLAFGLLLFWPLFELWRPALRPRAGLGLLASVLTVLALSNLYEILEWGAAEVVDPDTGLAFVGAQGDPWDSQKDAALAFSGALGMALACGGLGALRVRAARRAGPSDRPRPGRARDARRPGPPRRPRGSRTRDW